MDTSLLAQLRQALIDARDAAVPETVRRALVALGDDLTNLLQVLGDLAVDALLGEKVKILSKLLRGEAITAEDWAALAFELLSDLALGPGGKALMNQLLEPGSRSLAKVRGALTQALESRGAKRATEKVDDALRARHARAAAPEGVQPLRSATDVAPGGGPLRPPVRRPRDPSVADARAPRGPGAEAKAPPQHGGEVAARPARQSDPRPARGPDADAPSDAPGSEGRLADEPPVAAREATRPHDTTGKRSPIVRRARPSARGGTYVWRDPETGQVVRTGRTNDLSRRAGEHARDPALRDYVFEEVHRTDVYAEQRGLEQMLHEHYNAPLDKINAVSPTNPRRTEYMDAARSFLEGG